MARKVGRIPQRHSCGTASILQRLWTDIRGSISLLIITVCIGGFFALAALNLFYVASWSQTLSALGLSYIGVVHRLWLFQFLTAPLLHASLTHLAFNMLTLWMLGPEVERAMGRRQYVVFSALCAGCAMAGFLLWNPGTGAIGLGYSGVIFGLLVAQATFFPERVLYIYAFFPLKMKYAVLVLGAVELYLTVTPERSGIAHAAHLFGALGAWGYLQGARRWTRRTALPTAWSGDGRTEKPAHRTSRKDIPWEL
jgi:membrane associated rhomboid family serine protease